MMKGVSLILSFILVFSLFTFFFTSEASANDSNANDWNNHQVHVAVLYYPWYQLGNGTGHWSNRTEWKVVDIPVLGYYSTQNLSTLKTQLDWMSDAGIDTILVSWWGPNPSYGEDNSTNMLFYAIQTYHPEMRAFVMVEEILFGNAVSQSMIDSFYNYLWTQYITPYGDIYMNLDGKPLVTWWGSLNMTDDLSHRNYIWYSDFAQNTTIRIIGSQDYVNWSCWRPPTYDGQSDAPPVDQQDGFVFIEPRYDDTFKTMWNTNGIFGTSNFDQNLTIGLYDSQCTTVISRQKNNGDIRIVCIYSWNSFDERSAIEPCTDYTVPDLDQYYLLNKTKLFIDQLRTVRTDTDIHVSRDLANLTASCFIIVIGAVISFLYLFYDRIEDVKRPNETKNEPSAISGPRNPLPSPDIGISRKDLFILQYEQLSEAIHSRDNMTIVGGTILITASVLLLGSSLSFAFQRPIDFSTRLIFVSAALAVYIVWLMCFNLTSNRLNNVCYSRAKRNGSKNQSRT